MREECATLERELARLRAEVEQKRNLLVTAIRSVGDQAARAERAEAARDALAAAKLIKLLENPGKVTVSFETKEGV
jgi:hypothetical protein